MQTMLSWPFLAKHEIKLVMARHSGSKVSLIVFKAGKFFLDLGGGVRVKVDKTLKNS